MSQSIEPLTEFRNTSFGFSIRYPQRWRVLEQATPGRATEYKVAFIEPARGARRRCELNVVIGPLAPSRTGSSAFEETLRWTIALQKGELVSTRELQVAGEPGFEGIYVLPGGFCLKRKLKKVVLVYGAYEYSITGMVTPARRYANLEYMLDECIKTLSFHS